MSTETLTDAELIAKFEDLVKRWNALGFKCDQARERSPEFTLSANTLGAIRTALDFWEEYKHLEVYKSSHSGNYPPWGAQGIAERLEKCITDFESALDLDLTEYNT